MRWQRQTICKRLNGLKEVGGRDYPAINPQGLPLALHLLESENRWVERL